uniref:NTF2-related export protein n=1 Tax=Strigamia maritima TaxID=126957 RepID=T1JER8_STRMM
MAGSDSLTILDQDCRTAIDFAELYFKTLDKCRHKLAKLYMDDARLLWNGNCVNGNEAITMFYKNLPISETLVCSLDTQRVLGEAVNGQTTILVLVAGTIKFQEKLATPFQQNFVLTVQKDDTANIIDQDCVAADKFTTLYFNNLDKCRHKLATLYMDDARLVWNGNCVNGKEEITMFYKNLPISETTLCSLDTQRVLGQAVNGQATIVVLVAGTIKFQEKPSTSFHQNFVLTVQKDVWKVATDCFRFQETVS